jgi:hypothetical protein
MKLRKFSRKSMVMVEQKLSVVLFSYIPYLDGPPGITFDPSQAEALTEILEEFPTGEALACLWVGDPTDPGKILPIFLYDDADNLLDHLLHWAENKPTEWFSLHLKEKKGKYVIALIPKMEKSIERYQIAYQLQTGYPMPKDTKTNVIFRSLYMLNTNAGSVFSKHRDKVSNPLKVGFLDASRVDKDDMVGSMKKINESEIRWIGPFKLAENKPMKGFLDGLLDDAKPGKWA